MFQILYFLLFISLTLYFYFGFTHWTWLSSYPIFRLFFSTSLTSLSLSLSLSPYFFLCHPLESSSLSHWLFISLNFPPSLHFFYRASPIFISLPLSLSFVIQSYFTLTYTHTHTHIHIHTHTYTHSHTHKHKHTQTHTHTGSTSILLWSCWNVAWKRSNDLPASRSHPASLSR